MDIRIWQASAGGLLWAAGVLTGRAGVDAPPFDPGGAGTFLEQAQRLVLKDRTVSAAPCAMACVFDHLNGGVLRRCYPHPWSADADMPKEEYGCRLAADELHAAAARLAQKLPAILQRQDYAALEGVCEAELALVPAFPGDADDGDLSLFDVGRMIAALAACLVCADAAQSGRQDASLLLFSCDFSGIQDFIYTISTKNALRMLRSRSLFLELLMEHTVDTLLEACGLARANCLYAGGGHAYLLLPDTAAARAAARQVADALNAWLVRQFDVALYLACAWTPCTAQTLLGADGAQAYADVFRTLSAEISAQKLHRYAPQALRELNSRPERTDGRECRVCGRSTQMPEHDADGLCTWCRAFADLSAQAMRPDAVFAVTEEAGGIPLPACGAPLYLAVLTAQQAVETDAARHAVRLYAKEPVPEQLCRCTRLWMGDWCSSSLLEELAADSTGIRRLGIWRADVDNLGHAFVAGFSGREQAGTPAKNYTDLLRTAAFSHSMTRFFKRDINALMEQTAAAAGGLMILYAGGDDLFVIGAWNAALAAAVKLRDAFAAYTGGALTLSGGLGLYKGHYPLARAAQETALLEDFAKQNPGKDAIVLFSAQPRLRFSWDVFEHRVLGEKRALLASFFDKKSAADSEQERRGSAFLYRLLLYLRGAQDKLNLARCAYLLARLAPEQKTKDSVRTQEYEEYRRFADQFYAWLLQPEDRMQLEAAIELTVYSSRQPKE